ncbi:helix-turn-helix domain-containing protein [Paenibacillus sp. LMG 31456]|uniref:Helix-turn-helix domain-containing protein n=1 Tax=Paenibacillus foliorum TaxID=2654974 RepID=A0A972K354_9BACL|nr:helix-turn-helix domain-containing protein [Paenibacillus foliorum]NOU96625.1 helix-turn-helix domain-containing protein [Paenibacillus foliorum]
MVKKKFLYKMLTLFIVIVLLYSVITSSIIFYKSYQMADAQNNHSNQLFIDQNSNYADFKLRTAMELVYKISTLQSLIDYRYSTETNYLHIVNLHHDLIHQLQGFGQLGFTFGITKLTDDMVITAAGTYNIKNYLNELGIDPEALDRFHNMESPILASNTYVVPQSLSKKPGNIVMLHQIVNSKLDPLYFFIVIDSSSLLPGFVDNLKGNFYLHTNETISSYIHNKGLDKEILTRIDARNEQEDINHLRVGSTINYIHPSKVIPNLNYVYSSESTSFGTVFIEIWKTALFPSVLLLLLGIILAYMATRSSYKPIRQLLQFLDEQKGNSISTASSNEHADQIHELAYIQSSIEQVYSINHSLQNKLDHSFVHLREDFFRKVIYGIASEEFIQENLSAMQLEKFQEDLNIILLECNGIEALDKTAPAPNLSLIFNTIIREIPCEYEDFFTLPLDKNKYCIIFNRISSESLKQIAETVINIIEKDLSLDITACISSTYQLNELTSALQELLRMSNNQYATTKKVLTSQNVKDLEEAVCYYPIETEACLINYVNSNELGKAHDLLRNLLDHNINQTTLNPVNLSNLKHSILSTFKRCLNTNGTTLNQFIREYPDQLNEFMKVPVSKFTEKTFTLFELIFNYCNKDKFSLESSTASQIFIYIHKHFDKDLSLTDIADQFNLSESYVSKLLKNSLDINFKQYVNTLKVKRAKELLNQGNYKVHEVAVIVGCNNTNSFIRIFKQYIGVSPGEYIKNLN